MQIFLLTQSDYRRSFIVDEYESFIWTERYSDYGDFSIVVRATKENRSRFQIGKFITHTESERFMIIEEVFIKKDAEGNKTMEVSGRSFEAIFMTRSITQHMDYQGSEIWNVSGYMGNIVTLMVKETCVDGHAALIADIIPELAASNLTGDTASFDLAIKAQSLYTAIKELCDSEGYGFRVRLTQSSPKLQFEVYKGQRRPGVIFSSMMENLVEESHLTSQMDHYNVAYVWARDGYAFEIVYYDLEDQNPPITGYARRVMHVDASDIDPDPAKVTYDRLLQWLRGRGRQALTSQQFVDVFDGEVAINDNYKYGSDFGLGDTVVLVDLEGNTYNTKVTEYIWAHDREGLRSYPTFQAIT